MQSRNILKVTYGDYIFDTWYHCLGYFDPTNATKTVRVNRVREPVTLWGNEPFKGFTNGSSSSPQEVIDILHICDGCFKYTVREEDMVQHRKLCRYLKMEPPGDLVYEDTKYRIYRVDGSKHKLFCQCMCLFGKLFLDSKSIYFAVEGFEFFILVESRGDTPGPVHPRTRTHAPATTSKTKASSGPARVLGFFSKEKISWHDYNLACILVFPPFQKLGLGRQLIAFSYYLTRSRRGVSAPEKPLSVHGQASYLRYWAISIAQRILIGDHPTLSVSVAELSQQTGIEQGDVLEALNHMNALEDGIILVDNIQQWVDKNHISLEPILDESACL